VLTSAQATMLKKIESGNEEISFAEVPAQGYYFSKE
jgi:hypothetical protein